MSNKKQRVLWLTNLPAPYRLPIWESLSHYVDLKVVFTLKEKNWRNWLPPISTSWSHLYLSYRSIKIGEFVLVPNFIGAKKILANVDTVIIGGWESPMFMRTTFLAKKRGLRVVHFYESTLQSHRFKNRLVNKIRSSIFSAADFVITPGSDSTQAVIAMGIPTEKIVTLFNPVDVEWFNSLVRSKPSDKTPGHKFLYVGQLIPRKNVSALIEAFAAIKQADDKLLIAGQGPLLTELKAGAAILKVSDSVEFLGHKSPDDLAAIYASSNTFILPSTNEVWGLVVNEALACGLHAVVSDSCGVANFVEPMKGVYICESTSSDIAFAMAKARDAWSGYISEPEILKYTPKKFAESLLELILIK